MASAGCAGPRAAPKRVATIPPDAHVPNFARVPFEPISRQDVVAIAIREWRLWGQPVDDDPPGTRPPLPPESKPERWAGLWERVGEYWWLGINAGDRETAWTGKHDEHGIVFPANEDGDYAWSAAFVSYVMRVAGAGPRFPYAIDHADYINVAKQQTLGRTSGYIISAQRPEAYPPQPGDLICFGRGRAGALRFDDLPAATFPSHCDIVVQTLPGQLAVIGGNVDDSVTMKHVPVTPDGKLANPDGTTVDTRYPWMVVLRVLYETPIS